MPEWLKDLTGAAAVIVVVIVFLKFLAAERKERAVMSKNCHDAHETRAKAFEKVVERNSGAITENSGVIGANTAFLMKLTNGGKKG